jgi:hypothetical protein
MSFSFAGSVVRRECAWPPGGGVRGDQQELFPAAVRVSCGSYGMTTTFSDFRASIALYLAATSSRGTVASKTLPA